MISLLQTENNSVIQQFYSFMGRWVFLPFFSVIAVLYRKKIYNHIPSRAIIFHLAIEESEKLYNFKRAQGFQVTICLKSQ